MQGVTCRGVINQSLFVLCVLNKLGKTIRCDAVAHTSGKGLLVRCFYKKESHVPLFFCDTCTKSSRKACALRRV